MWWSYLIDLFNFGLLLSVFLSLTCTLSFFALLTFLFLLVSFSFTQLDF
jgi:hypothetical protein